MSNVKRLVAQKMSMDAVPKGGGFMDAIRYLSNGPGVVESARKAQEWVNAAIQAVKLAKDNPYGDDDEAIAGEILRKIAERKGAT